MEEIYFSHELNSSTIEKLKFIDNEKIFYMCLCSERFDNEKTRNAHSLGCEFNHVNLELTYRKNNGKNVVKIIFNDNCVVIIGCSDPWQNFYKSKPLTYFYSCQNYENYIEYYTIEDLKTLKFLLNKCEELGHSVNFSFITENAVRQRCDLEIIDFLLEKDSECNLDNFMSAYMYQFDNANYYVYIVPYLISKKVVNAGKFFKFAQKEKKKIFHRQFYSLQAIMFYVDFYKYKIMPHVCIKTLEDDGYFLTNVLPKMHAHFYKQLNFIEMFLNEILCRDMSRYILSFLYTDIKLFVTSRGCEQVMHLISMKF